MPSRVRSQQSADITAAIKNNGNREISAQVLRTVLIGLLTDFFNLAEDTLPQTKVDGLSNTIANILAQIQALTELVGEGSVIVQKDLNLSTTGVLSAGTLDISTVQDADVIHLMATSPVTTSITSIIPRLNKRILFWAKSNVTATFTHSASLNTEGQVACKIESATNDFFEVQGKDNIYKQYNGGSFAITDSATGGGGTGGTGPANWGTITGTLASQLDLWAELEGKEPVIGTKLDAFNRAFGSTATTVARGNHTQSIDTITGGAVAILTNVISTGQSRELVAGTQAQSLYKLSANQSFTFTIEGAAEGKFIAVDIFKDTTNIIEITVPANSQGEDLLLLAGSKIQLSGGIGTIHTILIRFVTFGVTTHNIFKLSSNS